MPRLPDPESWEATAFGVAQRPWTWFARGIAFSGSSGPWFSAYAVVVPLFVPTTVVDLLHGKDLPGPGGQRGFDQAEGSDHGQRAQEVAESYVTHGLALVEARGQLNGFLQHLRQQQDRARADGSEVPYAEEAGYCLLLLGDRAGAVEQLTLAARPLPADAPTWSFAVRRRAVEILALMDDVKSAQGRLQQWASASAAALGLGDVDGAR